MNLLNRPRRNRKNKAIQNMLSENSLKPEDLVLPLFISENQEEKSPIKTLPDIYRYNLNGILKQCENALSKGIQAVALFPQIQEKKKNNRASEALNENGLIPIAIRRIKEKFPELCLISDIALDPFSSDGHDGILVNNKILNDESVTILSDMALLHAASGVDIVAPSDMMDGRVGEIRKKLDAHAHQECSILAYSAKYASVFYGPFRDALQSEPKSGDKKTYQLNPANTREALLEASLDQKEGADILMVKPAGIYLDIIYQLSKIHYLPIAAYQVSGEYAMIKFAAKMGCFDALHALHESVTSIKRAGADLIFTYAAMDLADFVNS
eukprot:COSAG01_NODE_14_length_41020_cov_40.702133_37_plen_326_part_00